MNYKEIIKIQRKYFNTGSTLSYNHRLSALINLKAEVLKYEARLVNALYLDLGKSGPESYLTEIGLVLKEISFQIKNLKKMMKAKKVKTPLTLFPATSYIVPEPYGTVLIISPWNYPVLLALNPLIGAIAAGNTVILKPSEISVQTTKVLVNLIKDTFQDHFVTIIEADADDTSKLLEERFDYIFFTGSPNVGKIVMNKASKNLTPITLELGGKSPVVIKEDAKLELAVKRLTFGKLINAGQTCIAPDYLMIQEDLLEDFIKMFRTSVKDFYGEEPLNNNDYPKIINKSHFERLKSYLKDEQIIFGGESNETKIAPTLVKVKSFNNKLMTEEIFGPILPVITYNKIDEVYQFIEANEKPLAAYFFSEDKAFQAEFVKKVSAGGIVLNDTIMHFANNNLPFGGVGMSGMGKYHGKSSFKTFTHYKSVLNKATCLDIKIRYHPLTNDKITKVKKMMK